jgi:hypothetical protein
MYADIGIKCGYGVEVWKVGGDQENAIHPSAGEGYRWFVLLGGLLEPEAERQRAGSNLLRAVPEERAVVTAYLRSFGREPG